MCRSFANSLFFFPSLAGVSEAALTRSKNWGGYLYSDTRVWKTGVGRPLYAIVISSIDAASAMNTKVKYDAKRWNFQVIKALVYYCYNDLRHLRRVMLKISRYKRMTCIQASIQQSVCYSVTGHLIHLVMAILANIKFGVFAS